MTVADLRCLTCGTDPSVIDVLLSFCLAFCLIVGLSLLPSCWRFIKRRPWLSSFLVSYCAILLFKVLKYFIAIFTTVTCCG